MTDPNILLLLTDQERYDFSSPDGVEVETPAIDRLQEDGIRFDNAYTPIGICSSARASLMTGLYPHAHGMLNNCHEDDSLQPNLPEDIDTFSELLDEAGYSNTYIGKWHVGRDQTPEDFGFEYLGGGKDSADIDEPEFREFQREQGVDPDEIDIKEEIRTADGLLVAGKTTAPPEATSTYYHAEKTIERIEEAAEEDEPFFHRTDFPGPHFPYVVPEPYASMYDPENIEPWENFDEDFEDKPGVQEQFLHYRGVEDFDWDTWKHVVAKYKGFVSFIDHQIGRIMDAVDEYELEDSTAVIHTADHGDMTGSHRQFNKGPMMYEETYNIPLIMKWPGEIKPGISTDSFAHLHDLTATFLDMADIKIPDEMQSQSLMPVVKGEETRETAFAQYHGDEFGLYSQRMLRKGDWKYIYNGPDIDEMYNLENDPAELENLVESDENVEKRHELRSILADEMDRTDDPIRKWVGEMLKRSSSEPEKGRQEMMANESTSNI